MQHTTIGVDLAKHVFELAIANERGTVKDRKRLNRSQFARFFANHPPCQVVMETCGSAHHWARTLQAQGHSVSLLPAHYVKAYVRRNKTDRADATALLEAFRGNNLLPVPPKSEAQQAILGLHRIRQQWMHARTARLNLLRGLLREQGHAIPAGARQVVPAACALLEQLPPVLAVSLPPVIQEIRDLEARIHALEKELAQWAKAQPAVQHLMTLPGIGLLTATAMVAAIGDPAQFKNGRHLAAWLGITPREYSSGHRRYLGRITKRGDRYLRTLLIHGARAVLNRAKALARNPQAELNALQLWAVRLERRVGHNKAAVAVANKLARIIWATWFYQREYTPQPAVQ